MNPTVAFIKRGLDITFSLVGLAACLPLFIVIPILIKLDSEGDVFFIQERMGQDGKLFDMIKFRTMVKDAEKKSGPIWANENDSRITRLGNFLRKARLDEIPQLFNVLKGEMSLVGPRPERPYFINDLKKRIPYYDERIIAVKPGITGLAQINLEYDTSVDSVREKLLYDHAYGACLTRLDSFLNMEFLIIGRTFMTVLTGKGAH